jgi:ABC-type glycerol-3-phosphate transport system substrate-binding protein
VLTAAPALAVAACARRRDPDRVSLWAIDVEGENAKYLLPAFTRATGLPVDAQSLPWTAAHEKLLTAYAGGSLPDVFMISRAWVGEFAMLGTIQPVPPAARDLLLDNFATRNIEVDGRAMGVPWTLDVGVQYYRRDLVGRAGYAEPPADLDRWRDMLRVIKRRGLSTFAVLMQLNWPAHLLHIASQSGEPLLRDRMARGNFASAGFRDALAFYRSLFDEELAPRVSGIEAADPPGDLGRGWVAVYPSGAWIRAELLRRQAMLPRHLWATAPLPGRGGHVYFEVAGNVLCVSSTAADPARAWSLIRYLTGGQAALALHRIAGTLPARPSAWASPAMRGDPALLTFEQMLRLSSSEPKPMEWDRITGEIQLVAEQLVRGRMTLDEAAKEMNRRADAILAKRRWLLERGRIA